MNHRVRTRAEQSLHDETILEIARFLQRRHLRFNADHVELPNLDKTVGLRLGHFKADLVALDPKRGMIAVEVETASTVHSSHARCQAKEFRRNSDLCFIVTRMR